jgi:hypothetical protein
MNGQKPEEGGLIAYGPRLIPVYRQLARVVVKVLRGADPQWQGYRDSRVWLSGARKGERPGAFTDAHPAD